MSNFFNNPFTNKNRKETCLHDKSERLNNTRYWELIQVRN